MRISSQLPHEHADRLTRSPNERDQGRPQLGTPALHVVVSKEDPPEESCKAAASATAAAPAHREHTVSSGFGRALLSPNNPILRRIARVLGLTQVLALVLVGSLSAILISNARAYGESDDWVEQTHRVLDELDHVRVALLHGDVALRDFALVPKSSSLQRTRAAAAEALHAAQRLEALVQDNRDQAVRAAEVVSEVGEISGWYKSSATVGERDGGRVLNGLLIERVSADGSRRVRGILDDMEQVERQLLTVRENVQGQQLRSLKAWSAGLGAVFLAFMLGMIIYSRRLVWLGDRDMLDLAASASTDPLTGLGNRRALQDHVAQLKNLPFSVMAFDLDDFKPVNDRLGHAAGDEVLRVVAQRLKEQCRGDDVPIRLGGDEFLVLFPGLNNANRLELIQARVSAAITAPIRVEGTEIQVGASIGFASTGGDLSFKDLLAIADRMSFKKKKLRKTEPAWAR